MKKTTIVLALAAIFGLALAAVPALAQNEEPTTEQSNVCPFHNEDATSFEDMHRWMDSATHDQWMDTADHDRMHAEMGDMARMMNGYGAGPGNMSGPMMGGGNMMGFSRQP